MKYAINCSLLFKELPLLDRPTAAKAAGFDYIEYWWPWENAVPADSSIDKFVSAVKESGTRLIGLNFFAGTMPGPDRGVLCQAKRSAEFRANVPIALAIGKELGCKAFNALAGNLPPEQSLAESMEVAAANLAFAAECAKTDEAFVLLETLSGPGSETYLLKQMDDVTALIDLLGSSSRANVKMLADLYHMRVNGENVAEMLQRHASSIGHVQVADFPGRGQPGTGQLRFEEYFEILRRSGYSGYVALEYNPIGATGESFDQLPTL